jgi:hypothetical protein
MNSSRFRKASNTHYAVKVGMKEAGFTQEHRQGSASFLHRSSREGKRAFPWRVHLFSRAYLSKSSGSREACALFPLAWGDQRRGTNEEA